MISLPWKITAAIITVLCLQYTVAKGPKKLDVCALNRGTNLNILDKKSVTVFFPHFVSNASKEQKGTHQIWCTKLYVKRQR